MRPRSALPTLLLVGVVGALLYFVGWPCPVRAVTGVPCPGCGMTRAVRLLLAGDAPGATRMHPMVWLVVPAALALLVMELRGYARTGRWGRSLDARAARGVMVALALATFGVWLLRFAGWFGGPAPG